eukprot:CAMPEP_0119105494 /NCGR_PEP_ID=MMETSP1180-20130426/3434_1 /TAXON_ID=3052 ORGANISM="Chlamydomonas cf sp, Strain CCMP681" /NCGR_SAMPLE_ID=MMETSP1180 /ASSEMBLY_ACC=CAM_ASM_000741 /LENGTH=326 /DNA_ID=CAMNT_0007090545 /DNA_START=1 /DNA_END=978 /DNA_ORIENTATION=+
MSPICIDALNFQWFKAGPRVTHWQSVATARGGVGRTVDAFRRTGWEPIVFIDAALKTSEAQLKWQRRRKEEVKKEEKRVPQANSVILGELFSDAGVQVHYSLASDPDDTLAAYAQHLGGAVLSSDGDYQRYIGATYKQYSTFEVSQGTVILQPWQKGKRSSSPRNLPEQLPATQSTSGALTEIQQGIMQYMRGAPSPLVRKLGNPHVTVRSLRQALYSRMGVTELVVEKFPVWSEENQQVEWTEESVGPDPTLAHLLDHPQQAVAHIFPEALSPNQKPPGVQNVQWLNHVYAMHAVVFELCCLSKPGEVGKLVPMLETAGRGLGLW